MIHFLREEAVPSLARAEPGSIKYDGNGFPPATHDRSTRPTFSTTRLHDADLGSKLKLFDKSIGLMTGLQVENTFDPYKFASEPIQISAHAFGGHFYLHNDAVRIFSILVDFIEIYLNL